MTAAAERLHIARVKEMACAVCGAHGPSDAHHIIAGRTPGRKSPGFCVIPLCKDCHQGSFNGIHGQRRMWEVVKVSELDCLAATIERLYGGRK
jgi:5-methylcytosine-specific restriction endonuclease McrA